MSQVDIPKEKMEQLLTSPAYAEAVRLFSQDIILRHQAGEIRSQLAEAMLFDPISSGFETSFSKFEREKGQLFVPIRRGWPQPNVVTNPDPEKSSVIQINKVIVNGQEGSFGSLLKITFPGDDFDGYDLYGAPEDAKITLAEAVEDSRISVSEDVRGKALAVLRRMRV